MEYIINNENEMVNFAESIARTTTVGTIILLNGDLGSGKTFFSNAFINYFNKIENRNVENITSPTFNIVKSYKTNNFNIYHFDLYRIKKKDELLELDLDSAFENISLIEWPDLIMDFLPHNNIINIDIKIITNNTRKIVVSQL